MLKKVENKEILTEIKKELEKTKNERINNIKESNKKNIEKIQIISETDDGKVIKIK